MSVTLWLVSLPDKWTHNKIIDQEFIIGGHLEIYENKKEEKKLLGGWYFLNMIVIACPMGHRWCCLLHL